MRGLTLAMLRGISPSRAIANMHARLPVEDREHHARDRHQRAERHQARGPRDARALVEHGGERRLGLLQRLGVERADRRDRDEDVDDRAEHERADDRDRQVPFRLAAPPRRRSRPRRSRCRRRRSPPRRSPRRRCRWARTASRLSMLNADANATTMKNARIASLKTTMMRLALAVSRTPRTSRNVTRRDDRDGRQVHLAAVLGRVRDRLGQREPERVLQELVEVAAPADGDGRRPTRRTRGSGPSR